MRGRVERERESAGKPERGERGSAERERERIRRERERDRERESAKTERKSAEDKSCFVSRA